MKKLLAFLLIATLGGAVAQALPFVPTSDPDLTTNYWYFLKTEGFYCAGSSSFEIVFKNSGDANNDNYLWCFVGNSDSGYRLYNKGTGRYLQQEGLVFNDSYTYTYYEDKDGSNFYLKFYIPGWNVYYYLFMNIYQDQYGFMRYMDTDPETKGIFSVEIAKEGAPVPADPVWTRHDMKGVGYGFIEGGNALNATETSNNLCDNNAATKYFGLVSNCWFTMKASTDVAVEWYSIVTANDSRQYYDRTLRSWKLQGSNDYNTWVDIDVKTDYPMPFADQKEVIFYVNDSRKFRFFRFEANGSGKASETVQISEVWINRQLHNWGDEIANILPTCGEPGNSISVCGDCGAKDLIIKNPTGNHNFVDGTCTVCHIHENETILLHNGQRVPYFMWGVHDYRTGAAGSEVWPDPPTGWPGYFELDLTKWHEVLMPTASPGHSNGAFNNLVYNSHWYGEYNCNYFIRLFVLNELNPNDIFTFNCVHDDNMVVYVNEQEVINIEGWTPTQDNWESSHESFNIPASAFCQGKNIVSVYIQQNWGGAYFDCELRMKTASSVPGDVNGDGDVTGSDVTALYNHILFGQDTEIFNGDQNGDGEVTGSDVTAVYNIILGL